MELLGIIKRLETCEIDLEDLLRELQDKTLLKFEFDTIAEARTKVITALNSFRHLKGMDSKYPPKIEQVTPDTDTRDEVGGLYDQKRERTL